MTVVAPVKKSIQVKASVERAFRVFTAEIDTWWPRTHHIGGTPMIRNVMETREGGRCYSEHEGGRQVDWGKVLVWEPPQRFVMAWQVNPSWQYEPDLAKSSEVEVRFSPLDNGRTQVDLEHRYFERHGSGSETMYETFDGPGAWSGMLDHFRELVDRES